MHARTLGVNNHFTIIDDVIITLFRHVHHPFMLMTLSNNLPMTHITKIFKCYYLWCRHLAFHSSHTTRGAPYNELSLHVLHPMTPVRVVMPSDGYSMVHSPHRRLSDVLKRKKPPKRTGGRKSSRGEEPGLEFFSTTGKGGASGSTRSAPTTRGKLLAGEWFYLG